MSIALMTQAWKSGLPAGRKMVLLALCDNANDQGECYPSIAMLAHKCSMGERTVQQHIAEMEGEGIIERELRSGRSTVYRLDPCRFGTPAGSAPPRMSHPPPAKSAPAPRWNRHPTPADAAPITIKEPSMEPPGKHNRKPRGKPGVAPGLEDLVALGVGQQVAADWLTIRAGKRLPLTRTALEGMVADVAHAGMSMADAVRICCQKGWARFDASWLSPQPARPPGPGYQSATDKARSWAASLNGENRHEQPDDASFIDLN